METRANHVLIGAFTIVVFLLGVAVRAVGGEVHLRTAVWEEYDVIFTESVTGLGIGSLVQYNGITVGEVRNLQPRRRTIRARSSPASACAPTRR